MNTTSSEQKRAIGASIRRLGTFYSIAFRGNVITVSSIIEQPDDIKAMITSIAKEYQFGIEFFVGEIPESWGQMREQ